MITPDEFFLLTWLVARIDHQLISAQARLTFLAVCALNQTVISVPIVAKKLQLFESSTIKDLQRFQHYKIASFYYARGKVMYFKVNMEELATLARFRSQQQAAEEFEKLRSAPKIQSAAPGVKKRLSIYFQQKTPRDLVLSLTSADEFALRKIQETWGYDLAKKAVDKFSKRHALMNKNYTVADFEEVIQKLIVVNPTPHSARVR